MGSETLNGTCDYPESAVLQEGFLDVLYSLATTISKTTGVSEEDATLLANRVVSEIKCRYGGRSVYVHSKKERNTKILVMREYNGKNKAYLSAKFGITRRRINQIITDNLL